MAEPATTGAARLAQIIDRLPDALLVVETGGRVVNANARAIDLLQAPGTQLVGTPLLQLIPGFRLRRRLADGRDVPLPQPHIANRLDGATIPVEVSGATLAGGSAPLVLLTIRTRELATSDDLHTQEYLESVLRSAAEAIFGVDLDGRVVLVNPAAVALMGIRAAELAGQRLHDLALHSDREHQSQPWENSPIKNTLETGELVRTQPTIVWRADGSYAPVDMTVFPVRTRRTAESGGTIVGGVVVLADRRDLVSAQERAEELSVLLATEVYAGLEKVQGHVRKAISSAGTSMGRAPRLAVGRARKEVDRLLGVVGDRVEHQRIVSGSAELHPQKIALGELVKLAVSATSRASTAAGVAITVLPEDLVVEVDPQRAVEALTEVLGEAIRQSPRGSAIAVTAGRRGDQARVVVRDARPRVEGQSAAATTGGIDIGFVRAVAQRHGGGFAIEPAPGGGTAYSVEFPLVETGEQIGALVAGPPATGKRRRPKPAPKVPPAPAEEASPQATAADVPSRTPPVADPVATEPPGAEAATEAPGGAEAQAGEPPAAKPPAPQHREATGQEILVWPNVDEATVDALASRGCALVPIQRPQDVTDQARRHPGALLVDPLAGPVTRTTLTRVRDAAATAGVPLLVAAGLAEVTREDVQGADPAALLGALRHGGMDNSRVLLLGGDLALAEAMGETLERRGMHPLLTTSEAEAVLRAATAPPDLVMLDLALAESGQPGIFDWLRSSGRLPVTPIVAYSAAGLRPDHHRRLSSGETVLAVQARPEEQGVAQLLADLVIRLAGASTVL